MPVDTERRDFLKTSGLLTGMLAAGSPLALIAPSRVWAVELKKLTSPEGATVLAIARTIAPHDKLENAAYAVVVRAIDQDAAKDPATLAELRAGLPRLGARFAIGGVTDDVQNDRAARAETHSGLDDDAVRWQLAAHRTPPTRLARFTSFVPQSMTEPVQAHRLSRGGEIELQLEFRLVARDRRVAKSAW